MRVQGLSKAAESVWDVGSWKRAGILGHLEMSLPNPSLWEQL